MHLKNIIHVKVLETMRKSLSSVCTRVRSYHRYARIIIIIVVIIIYAETAFIRRRGALKLPETDTHKSKYNGPENFINAVRSCILAWRAAKKKIISIVLLLATYIPALLRAAHYGIALKTLMSTWSLPGDNATMETGTRGAASMSTPRERGNLWQNHASGAFFRWLSRARLYTL